MIGHHSVMWGCAYAKVNSALIYFLWSPLPEPKHTTSIQINGMTGFLYNALYIGEKAVCGITVSGRKKKKKKK